MNVFVIVVVQCDQALRYHTDLKYRYGVVLQKLASVKGLRPDTWFAPSTLSFHTIVKFIYWWSTEQTSIEFCKREIDMNHNTS